MQEHILVKLASVYAESRVKSIMPKQCHFDNLKGYWVNQNRGTVMMLDKDVMFMGTKKEDIESGEDQKGE